MWFLAACDNSGRCIGFLRKDNSISEDPDNEINELMSFKSKKDSNEKIMQNNLGHLLLPDGNKYRLVAVKG